MRFRLIAFISLFLILSCKEEIVYIPKPRLYPKVEYPKRIETIFDTSFCSFSIRYPSYMKFVQDTTYLHKNAPHPCWFNLEMPSLNGTIHFTYTDLNKSQNKADGLYKIYADAYKMAEEHISKANKLEDFIINNPNKKVYGVLFNIEGHVASPFQIVITDSVNHALRASLYFNSKPNADSMAPVIEFVKEDLMGILNSLEWKKR